jgi:hypothetical protein
MNSSRLWLHAILHFFWSCNVLVMWKMVLEYHHSILLIQPHPLRSHNVYQNPYTLLNLHWYYLHQQFTSVMRNNVQMKKEEKGENKKMYYKCILVRWAITYKDAPYLFIPQPHTPCSYTLPTFHNINKKCMPNRCFRSKKFGWQKKRCSFVITHPKLPLQNSWQISNNYNTSKVKLIWTT